MENFALRNLIYFIAIGIDIFLLIVIITKAWSDINLLQIKKGQIIEQLGLSNSENFAKDYRLFQLRQGLTSGSKVPGILHLTINLVICYLAIFDSRILSPSDSRCPEIDPYKENKPRQIHYMAIKYLTFVMGACFAIVLTIKLTSVLSFALCPILQYKVIKKCKRETLPLPDPEHNSQKTLNFRLAL